MNAPRIRVTPAALEDLAARVAHVRSDLAASSATFKHTAVGVRTVEDALGDFDRAWSDRRAVLVELLESCAQALRSTAEAFATVDAQLGGALEEAAPAAAGSGP